MATTDTGTGFRANGSELILSANFYHSDPNNCAIYDLNDFKETMAKYPDMLKQMMGVETIQFSEPINDITQGDRFGLAYDFTVSYEDFSGKGRVYVMEDPRNFGVYITYYVAIDQGKDPAAAAKQGEDALASLTAPEIIDGEYYYYIPENKTFMFLIRTDLATEYSNIEDYGIAPVVALPDGQSTYIQVAREDFTEYGFTAAQDYLTAYEEAMGGSGAVVQYMPAGRYSFAYIQSTFTDDDGTQKPYILAAYTAGDGIFYTIYADGTEEQLGSIMMPIIQQIVWSFHIGVLDGYVE